ncbi:MAG: hypothetical protein JST50_17245 [Bacteroidetes bacterium]|jgi:hypothetical protein|nr:hypothetical protein [Bacteroidota bacterium]
MNILSTSKGRVIILLLLVSLFGLRLTASASTRMRMVCDTDTTAKKKANKQVLSNDTTLVIKGGSTILRNADTILIINGVPTKISKASPQVKPDPGINMDGGAKADSIAKGFQVAPASKIRTIYTPTEGTIQVKNNPGDQPTNTTIVAPPTDGVIQVRGGGNQGQVSSVPAPGGKVPAVIPTPGAGAAGNATSGNASPGQDTTSGKANPASGTVTNGEIQVGDQNAAGNAKNGANGKVVEKHDTTTVLTHDTTTLLKKDTTTIIKRDTTTILQRDTVTIIKKDTVTITKRDTIGGGQTAEQDTTDYSQIKAKNYYLQIGGAGLAISANYDARFNAERNGFGYTIGIGGFSSEGNSVITIPFQINYLIGEHSSMLQVGGGATFLHSTGNNTGKTWSFDRITGFVATGSFGYRYQPEQKGISFKVEFVPILYDEGIIPAGGISIGYTFK